MARERAAFTCQPVATHFPGGRAGDARRTALREAAYIRRTRFTKGEAVLHDFSCRSEDLFMLVNIIPENAPAWVRSPFLRWQLADEVTEAEGELDGIRAWHVCGDLRPGLTRGEWLDAVERLVRDALPDGVVADIAGHFPASKPPHAHILVAARHLDHKCYGAADYSLYDRINTDLRAPWLRWIAG